MLASDLFRQPPRNRWRRIDSETWMCFNFDVWRACRGVWFASYYGFSPRFNREFRTAQEAMRYCDNLEQQ